MRRILGGLELVSAWEPEVDVTQISTLVIPKIAIAIIIIIITIITIIIIVVFNLSKKTQTLILRGPVLKPCVQGSVAFQHRFLFLMRFAAFLNDPGSKINFPLYQVSRSYWPLSAQWAATQVLMIGSHPLWPTFVPLSHANCDTFCAVPNCDTFWAPPIADCGTFVRWIKVAKFSSHHTVELIIVRPGGQLADSLSYSTITRSNEKLHITTCICICGGWF